MLYVMYQKKKTTRCDELWMCNKIDTGLKIPVNKSNVGNLPNRTVVA